MCAARFGLEQVWQTIGIEVDEFDQIVVHHGGGFIRRAPDAVQGGNLSGRVGKGVTEGHRWQGANTIGADDGDAGQE